MKELIDVFYRAFDHFNTTLFDGKLPSTIITLVRKEKSKGYYLHNSLQHRGTLETVHEIALNPQSFNRDDILVFSTLVHEMCHMLDAIENGMPKAAGYHQKTWASIMLDIGLEPVSADQPGKHYGYKVTHDIIPNGKFANAAIEFCSDEDNTILFSDWFVNNFNTSDEQPHEDNQNEQEQKEKSKRLRRKVSCSCGLSFTIPMGANVSITCETCQKEMTQTVE